MKPAHMDPVDISYERLTYERYYSRHKKPSEYVIKFINKESDQEKHQDIPGVFQDLSHSDFYI